MKFDDLIFKIKILLIANLIWSGYLIDKYSVLSYNLEKFMSKSKT